LNLATTRPLRLPSPHSRRSALLPLRGGQSRDAAIRVTRLLLRPMCFLRSGLDDAPTRLTPCHPAALPVAWPRCATAEMRRPIAFQRVSERMRNRASERTWSPRPDSNRRPFPYQVIFGPWRIRPDQKGVDKDENNEQADQYPDQAADPSQILSHRPFIS
jgi:hypothetical protein